MIESIFELVRDKDDVLNDLYKCKMKQKKLITRENDLINELFKIQEDENID